jgi:hypothetical protein
MPKSFPHKEDCQSLAFGQNGSAPRFFAAKLSFMREIRHL